MRFTNREKIMMGAFVFICISAVYYKTILLPKFKQIEALTQELQKSNLEVEEQKIQNLSNDRIEKEYKILEDKIKVMEKDLFTYIHQEEIIIDLNNIIEQSGLEIQSMSFMEPMNKKDKTKADIKSEISRHIFSVTLNYEGSFGQVKEFVKRAEQNDKKILIKNLSIDTKEDGLLKGSIIIDYPTIPHIDEWCIDGNRS